ncbi:LysM peptidoglycan-binding domain-containing protein [Gelidibacter gilvus]|uniref:LysM peptidoglycan-binding domain-containing protein n=1 Tax=Gelidibacter gilvus TaxID=59602 RepID=A0A4Q0XHE0_9FLAO|nr:LysM peptidoglycan-binding domain-containing protein [Gelidibacter gilvus]
MKPQFPPFKKIIDKKPIFPRENSTLDGFFGIFIGNYYDLDLTINHLAIKMKRLFQCFTLLFLCFYTSIAQEGLKKHTVSSGETLFSIAKKYNVTPYDLQKINPEVIDGIKVDEVLLIPESKIKTPVLESASDSIKASVAPSSISYTVKTGETKYSLAKRFGLTITQLESQNPQITEGLQVGNVLEIYPTSSYPESTPSKTITASTSNAPNLSQQTGPAHDGKRHMVAIGETLARIANANGLTVDQLTEANSRRLSNGLIALQPIWIPGKTQLDAGNTYSYAVKYGDTKFGLSLRFNTTVAELVRQNPEIKNQLPVGQIISMPSEEIGSRPTPEVAQREHQAVDQNTTPKEDLTKVEQTKTVPTITETVVSTKEKATEAVPTVKETVVTTKEQAQATETVPLVKEVVVTTKEKTAEIVPTVKETVVPKVEQAKPTETVVKETIVTAVKQPKTTETLPVLPETVVTADEEPKEPETVSAEKETVVTKVEQAKTTEATPIITKPAATIEEEAIETVAKTTADTTAAPATLPKEKIKTPAETAISSPSEIGFLSYEIQPNDTLYGLAQRAGMSTADFLVLNPQLKESVQIGTIIKMPDAAKPSQAPAELISTPKSVRDFSIPVDLTKSANTSQLKKLLFFLPFSQEDYQSQQTNDNFKSVTDDFKRVHLEFYKGATIAIDSIRKMYLSLDVDVVEAQSSIRNSKIMPLLEEQKINDYDAIILPFYDTIEQEVAAFTADNHIPVITASTMDFQSSSSNLYSAIPSNNVQRKKILDYLMAKEAHIIVLNDVNRTESKTFISEYAPNIDFVTIKKNGSFSEGELIAKFKKDKLNFVVIDSERTSVFLNTTNVLLSELSNYNLQLAVLESALIPAEGHVSEKRFRILNMVFPSLIPAKSTASSKQFLSSYQKEYNLLPSANVMLGFDITFDSLLRLIQQQSFEDSAVNDITEYTQLKFDYEKNILGGFSNEGIYILQYDSDANIREAN